MLCSAAAAIHKLGQVFCDTERALNAAFVASSGPVKAARESDSALHNRRLLRFCDSFSERTTLNIPRNVGSFSCRPQVLSHFAAVWCQGLASCQVELASGPCRGALITPR